MRTIPSSSHVASKDHHAQRQGNGRVRSRVPMAHLCLLGAAWLARIWLRFVHRLHIDGVEHLPTDRSFVLVANHASHLDAIVLMAAIPWRRLPRTHPAAAADYFFRHGLAALLATQLLNAIPFARGKGGLRSLDRCRALLARRQRVLILFPEGTRSTDGALARFRSGIGRLVAGTAIPVVPCYVAGAGHAWPKGRRLPHPHPVRLLIGPPRRYAHLAATPSGARAVAGDLEAAVRSLEDSNHRAPANADPLQSARARTGIMDRPRTCR